MGATAIELMAPADTLPASPASSARTGTSAVSAPASKTPARSVSNRTSPAVIHTVPLGISRGASAFSPAVNRTVPCAAVARFRSSPRSWAWASRYSPSAVWGKAWRRAQSA